MNKFAQIVYGKVLFILETSMEMTELSTVFSPKTYWVDITGKDVAVGDIVEYSEDGFIFRKPTEAERKQTEAEVARESLDKLVSRAALALLTGEVFGNVKLLYDTALANVGDDVAVLLPEYYPVWDGNGVVYTKDYRLTYNGVLYKVLQDHTSQPDWTPEAAPSLFAKVLTSDDGTPLPWEQPDSTNPYMKGDRVLYNGKVYESLIDNNVWSPDGYPAGWKEVIEDS